MHASETLKECQRRSIGDGNPSLLTEAVCLDHSQAVDQKGEEEDLPTLDVGAKDDGTFSQDHNNACSKEGGHKGATEDVNNRTPERKGMPYSSCDLERYPKVFQDYGRKPDGSHDIECLRVCATDDDEDERHKEGGVTAEFITFPHDFF
ncbi:MAG: hypothetical protein IKS23_04950 [Alphaproteobacteria bacterium]|nr:hypothetical protein [Alphaproteobacteria bacterium]